MTKTVTNASSRPKLVAGVRIEPGEQAEFEDDDIDEDELHYRLEVEGETHECDECGRSFDSEQGLNTHKTKTHGGD